MVQDEDPLDQDEDSWEEVDSEPDSQDEGEIKAREGVQLLEEEELLEALKSAKGECVALAAAGVLACSCQSLAACRKNKCQASAESNNKAAA
jgi:hypothetical protein